MSALRGGRSCWRAGCSWPVIAGVAVGNLKPPWAFAGRLRASRLRCHRANSLQDWTDRLWPSRRMALSSPMLSSETGLSKFICGRWMVLEAKPIPGTEGAVNLFFARWTVARIFRRGKAQEGAGQRGSGTDYRGCPGWRQLGRPRHDRFQACGASPASAGRGGAPTPVTHLEKGETQPPLAGIPAGGKAFLFKWPI